MFDEGSCQEDRGDDISIHECPSCLVEHECRHEWHHEASSRMDGREPPDTGYPRWKRHLISALQRCPSPGGWLADSDPEKVFFGRSLWHSASVAQRRYQPRPNAVG
jgi:hypothetical protein